MGIGSKYVDKTEWFSTFLPINEEEVSRWLQTEYQEIGSKTAAQTILWLWLVVVIAFWAPLSRDFLGKNYGVGCRFPLHWLWLTFNNSQISSQMERMFSTSLSVRLRF